jgi:CheY-like chemotaxis protein
MKDYKEMIILIAEDDDGHADLIKEGLIEAGICNHIKRFADGEEIWNFFEDHLLKNDEQFTNSYLLLLDINMPKVDGIEVLRRVKGNEKLKEIPVIMLTTTDDPREVEECYKIGCNFYITKPVDFTKFAEMLKRLGLFIQVVRV